MKQIKYYWRIALSLITLTFITVSFYGNWITIISSAVIIACYIYYDSSLIKVQQFNSIKKDDNGKKEKNHLDKLNRKELSSIKKAYESTVVFSNDEGNEKTDIEAEDYFNLNNVFKSIKLNYRLASSGSGILVGLGLLGTFVGLTVGVSSFSSDTAEEITNSIKTLLNGMGSAFVTSLLGMFFSSLYIISEKVIINKLIRHLELICNYLNEKYYITPQEKYRSIYNRQNENLKKLFSYKDDEGNRVAPGNALRGIFEESEKQNEKLNSFTEELAERVVNEAMSKNLNGPLIEEVKNVTITLSEKLESFAKQVKSPGDNLAEGIVEDLKEAINSMLSEFKNNVSSMTTDKMNDLGNQLKLASDTLTIFPAKLEEMSTNMSSKFDKIDEIVSNLSNQASETNSVVIQQMQEQMNLASTNMNNMANNIKDTISKLNTQTAQTTEVMIERNEQSSAKTSELMNKYAHSMKQTEELLNNVNQTLQQFTKLQNETNIATSHISNLSKNAVTSTQNLENAQSNLYNQVEKNAIRNIESVKEIKEALEQAKQLPQQYHNDFNPIKESLGKIFNEINNGLNQYSSTVKESTGQFLNQYSDSMTKGVEQLSNTINVLGEVIEDFENNNKN